MMIESQDLHGDYFLCKFLVDHNLLVKLMAFLCHISTQKLLMTLHALMIGTRHCKFARSTLISEQCCQISYKLKTGYNSWASCNIWQHGRSHLDQPNIPDLSRNWPRPPYVMHSQEFHTSLKDHLSHPVEY
jgi:hypothetical protein